MAGKKMWSMALLVLGLGRPIATTTEPCCPRSENARRAESCCQGGTLASSRRTQITPAQEAQGQSTVALPTFAVSAGPGWVAAGGFALLTAGIVGAGSWLTLEIARAVTAAG